MQDTADEDIGYYTMYIDPNPNNNRFRMDFNGLTDTNVSFQNTNIGSGGQIIEIYSDSNQMYQCVISQFKGIMFQLNMGPVFSVENSHGRLAAVSNSTWSYFGQPEVQATIFVDPWTMEFFTADYVDVDGAKQTLFFSEEGAVSEVVFSYPEILKCHASE